MNSEITRELANHNLVHRKQGDRIVVWCNVCDSQVDHAEIQVTTPAQKVGIGYQALIVHTGEVIRRIKVQCHGETFEIAVSNWWGRIN